MRRYRQVEQRSGSGLGWLLGSAAGIFVGVLVLRSLPDLWRYLKMERM